MQVNEVKSEGLLREYNVKIDAKSINDKADEELTKISKTVKIAGFRPGHVPIKIVKQRYGKGVVGEVVEKLVHESSHKVLSERSLKAATQPKIEVTSFEENSDLEYKMAVELMPQIPEVDFSKIALEKFVAEVEEKEILEALDRLSQNSKNYVKLDGESKAEEGHQLLIDYLGRIDGVAFDGGTAKNAKLVLGSKSFIEGFETQLIGSKAGDEVLVKVTFPTEYHSKK
ncbi:MAG: trigger factor, partial [Pseudomonadota bacterium]